MFALASPYLVTRQKRVVLFDLDQCLIDSYEPTRDPLIKEIHEAIIEISPEYAEYSHEQFKKLTLSLGRKHNGNARGWAMLLGLSEDWINEIYRKAAKPMGKAVCKARSRDPIVIDGVRALQDDGVETFILTNATKDYCDIVVPHLLDNVIAEEKILHIGWANYLYKSKPDVFHLIQDTKTPGWDVMDFVDDTVDNHKAAHQARCTTWLNGGELKEEEKSFIHHHHPHIHQTLPALLRREPALTLSRT